MALTSRNRGIVLGANGEGVKRIAIIGGGVSGMACMWKLRHSNFCVDIIDAEGRLGGHANSVAFEANGRTVNVDTGFIAMNETTYPQFTAFLQELNVTTIPTDMSFGVSVNDGYFEWGSKSLYSFVGCFSNLFQLWIWRLLFDLVRFSFFAADLTEKSSRQSEYCVSQAQTMNLTRELSINRYEPIGQYLTGQGYSEYFLRFVLIPMVAAPWCTDPEDFSNNFPAEPLIHFMQQHDLLSVISTTLRWRSFKNGSKTYVDAFQSQLPSSCRLRLDTHVERISRSQNASGVTIHLSDGSVLSYDHVVLAVHANEALKLLGEKATSDERCILSCFKTSRNVCYLHSDMTHMPKRSSAHMAWNCLLQDEKAGASYRYDTKNDDKSSRSKISVTFDMNKLQAIPNTNDLGGFGNVLVTMNPVEPPSLFQSMHIYNHPLLSSDAIIASRFLHKINGVSGVSFAGAWMGWGFHEDGFAAGTHAAEMLIHGCDQVPVPDLFGLSPQQPRSKSVAVVVIRWLIKVIQVYFL